jgi:hypothetical protein
MQSNYSVTTYSNSIPSVSSRDTVDQLLYQWLGCGIPSTSPRATTRRPRGRAPQGRSRSRRGAAPGAPRGRANARSTGCHTAPSVQDHPWWPDIERRRRLAMTLRQTTDPGSGRGTPTTSIATSTPTDDRERPWTRTGIRSDPGRPAGSGEASAATTDLMTGRVVTPMTALPTATSSNGPPADPSQHASYATPRPSTNDTSRGHFRFAVVS